MTGQMLIIFQNQVFYFFKGKWSFLKLLQTKKDNQNSNNAALSPVLNQVMNGQYLSKKKRKRNQGNAQAQCNDLYPKPELKLTFKIAS